LQSGRLRRPRYSRTPPARGRLAALDPERAPVERLDIRLCHFGALDATE
jgi:hypothetical protein